MIKRTKEGIKKVWASIALLSIEMIVVLGLFLASLWIFIYTARKIFIIKDQTLDNFRNYLDPLEGPMMNKVMYFFTYLGKHEFLIPANLILIAYYLFIKKHKWYSIKIPAIAITSLLLMFGLKNFFGRSRPGDPLLEDVHGLSFPSGHALMAVTFYGLLIYIIFKHVENKNIKWASIIFLLLLIFTIGFSRIYFNVHYTSDVIAGFAMGFLWLVIGVYALNFLEKFSKRKVSPVVQEPQVPIGLK